MSYWRHMDELRRIVCSHYGVPPSFMRVAPHREESEMAETKCPGCREGWRVDDRGFHVIPEGVRTVPFRCESHPDLQEVSYVLEKQVLVKADHVDAAGHIFPRDVLEQAVEAAQRDIEQRAFFAFEGFKSECGAIQGMVSSMEMNDRGEVMVDVTVLDTPAGKKVRDLADPVPALMGAGAPVERWIGGRKVLVYRDVSLKGCALVERKDRVE